MTFLTIAPLSISWFGVCYDVWLPCMGPLHKRRLYINTGMRSAVECMDQWNVWSMQEEHSIMLFCTIHCVTYLLTIIAIISIIMTVATTRAATIVPTTAPATTPVESLLVGSALQPSSSCNRSAISTRRRTSDISFSL